MKTAVIGSRTFDNYEQLKTILDNLGDKPTEIISGGAKGADALAERYAQENDLPLTIHLANWQEYGKAAGPIRNQQIIEDCDQVVAMWDGLSKGTQHSIKIAKAKGKSTKVVMYAVATVAQTQQISLWG